MSGGRTSRWRSRDFSKSRVFAVSELFKEFLNLRSFRNMSHFCKNHSSTAVSVIFGPSVILRDDMQIGQLRVLQKSAKLINDASHVGEHSFCVCCVGKHCKSSPADISATKLLPRILLLSYCVKAEDFADSTTILQNRVGSDCMPFPSSNSSETRRTRRKQRDAPEKARRKTVPKYPSAT